MKIFLRHISSLREAQHELLSLGVDPGGVGIMAKKMLMKIFALKGLSVRAANILKQECIAVGADLALPKAASFLEGESTDAVLMASVSQLEMLVLNLRAQPFGLKEVGERLRDVLRSAGNFVYAKPKIMGIMNVTPDSFSDGGSFFVGGKIDGVRVMKRVEQMIDEGADIIDVGGESTGPGSKDVSVKEELARVRPVFEIFSKKKILKKVSLSVDTWKSSVARMAIEHGASIVNDVTALRGDKKMASVIAELNVLTVMMYSKDTTARTSRELTPYDDVMEAVISFLETRVAYAVSKGISRDRLILDPGMGAFVSGYPKYSLEILRRLGELKIFGLPLLVGPSRKSFIPGKLEERHEGGVASAVLAYEHGASMLRMHDVRAARRALDMAYSIVTNSTSSGT